MPIFDYRCKDCETIYEIFHKGKEIIEDIQCPSCGSFLSTKLLCLPSIISIGKTASRCDAHACGMDASCCGGDCELN
jgi:putative FmdB family regulatory protein